MDKLELDSKLDKCKTIPEIIKLQSEYYSRGIGWCGQSKTDIVMDCLDKLNYLYHSIQTYLNNSEFHSDDWLLDRYCAVVDNVINYLHVNNPNLYSDCEDLDIHIDETMNLKSPQDYLFKIIKTIVNNPNGFSPNRMFMMLNGIVVQNNLKFSYEEIVSKIKVRVYFRIGYDLDKICKKEHTISKDENVEYLKVYYEYPKGFKENKAK